MNHVIIYQRGDGSVSVVHPADCGLTINEIAAKDVPEGSLFKIVDASEVPADRTFRDAWEFEQ